MKGTHIVAFDVWDRQLICKILRNVGLAAPSGAGNHPHMTVMRRVHAAFDLHIHGACTREIHLGRRSVEVMTSVDRDRSHLIGMIFPSTQRKSGRRSDPNTNAPDRKERIRPTFAISAVCGNRLKQPGISKIQEGYVRGQGEV